MRLNVKTSVLLGSLLTASVAPAATLFSDPIVAGTSFSSGTWTTSTANGGTAVDNSTLLAPVPNGQPTHALVTSVGGVANPYAATTASAFAPDRQTLYSELSLNIQDTGPAGSYLAYIGPTSNDGEYPFLLAAVSNGNNTYRLVSLTSAGFSNPLPFLGELAAGSWQHLLLGESITSRASGAGSAVNGTYEVYQNSGAAFTAADLKASGPFTSFSSFSGSGLGVLDELRVISLGFDRTNNVGFSAVTVSDSNPTVPEPAALATLALAGGALLRRRARRA